MSGVGLVYAAGHSGHASEGHVEQPRRLEAVMELLEETGLRDQCVHIRARPASAEDLLLVHEPSLVNLVNELAAAGGGWIDVDTYVTSHSCDAGELAAGACMAAVDAVADGSVRSAFCAVRPPGHHAGRGRTMGFCLFDNAAVAARHAQRRRGVGRVAIVDFDVHHGNGTQDIFYDDPSVLFVSVHQYPYYPGTGHWEETGAGAARGATLNIPLPAGCGDAAYAEAFRRLVAPVVRRFRPELILVSAGFDGHAADPLAGMQVTAAGYRTMAETIGELADELCDGRAVYVLEGGYHPKALAWSVRACMDVMLGNPFAPDPNEYGPASGREPDIDPLVRQISQRFGLE